jgi:hypothetical protein
MFLTKMDSSVKTVNSLADYLASTFHVKHKPVKDSDDDNARYFHVVKLPSCIIPQPIVAKGG